MNGINFLVTLTIFALATFIALAYDQNPLQDFCVAVNEPKKSLFLNGKFCKNPKFVDVDDFYTSGLNSAGNTNNVLGSTVRTVNVDELPGINTLGISLARIDYAPDGLNPPHTHPRGSEILSVALGTLYVGFVSSYQDGNRLFTKILKQGDVFVFPIGMIHFEKNIGPIPAIAFTVLSSQNPGFISIANAVFGSDPSINSDVLAKAFKLEKKTIEFLQRQF